MIELVLTTVGDRSMIELILTTIGQLTSKNSTALLVFTVALLALISLRNGHIAERARQNVRESLYDLWGNPTLCDRQKRKRQKSLLDQNKRFISRYWNSSKAFLSLAAALFSVLIATVVGSADNTHSKRQIAAGVFGLLYFACLVIGLAHLVEEFRAGRKTLEMNDEAMILLSESRGVIPRPPPHGKCPDQIVGHSQGQQLS
jgi:hypothetical protein